MDDYLNEFYPETPPEENEIPDPEPIYNRHYIITDAQGRITEGWSDGPHPGPDTSGAICIDGEGGYQFRLFPGGEENPPLSAEDGVPLYRWDGEKAVPGRGRRSRRTGPHLWSWSRRKS